MNKEQLMELEERGYLETCEAHNFQWDNRIYKGCVDCISEKSKESPEYKELMKWRKR